MGNKVRTYAGAIRTTTGALVVLRETAEGAEADVHDRNDRAAKMGLQARYTFDPTPVTVEV